MNDNIVMIGFMGCGKTTVGKQLAAALEYQFLDTDAYIEEKEQMTISQSLIKREKHILEI